MMMMPPQLSSFVDRFKNVGSVYLTIHESDQEVHGLTNKTVVQLER